MLNANDEIYAPDVAIVKAKAYEHFPATVRLFQIHILTPGQIRVWLLFLTLITR